MKRLLFDVNIVLDVLLDRRPHADAASQAWALVEVGRAEGLLSAHAVTTIHYLNQKAVGPRRAGATTEALLEVFGVAPVSEEVLRAALALGWPDFEDAVTAAAARAAACHAIVTRDPKGFRRAGLPVLDPAAAAAWVFAT
ncbi:MAG: PIN domain-containing protein [Vicinamibacterales bacterium]